MRPRSDRRHFPTLDPTTLRRYLPALEAGERALRAQEKRSRQRFEPTSAGLAADAAGELAELQELIDDG